MHIDKLIEKLQRIKDELPSADVYFTAQVEDFNYELDFENFYIDTDNNNVEMCFMY